MKPLSFTLLLLFALTGISYAQDPARDAYPAARISVIDFQSGQQYPATSDDAILFKDALVNLVINTRTARMYGTGMVPGHKSVVITQADPQANGNAFQLSLQNTFARQTSVLYTFLYNVDQNTLYFYNTGSQNWVPEVVQGNNVINLNACLAYGKFNDPNAQPVANAPAGNIQQDLADTTNYDAPVDTAAVVDNPPPALPDYQQPECPVDGYLWQPGYWAYSAPRNDYYWVPGVWIAPPTSGYLWTPPYWGFYGGHYVFHHGYWGASIGFYGGINYGFGYVGVGYVGGEWHEGHFRYNTAVVRVNTVVVHNTYVNTTVINRTVVTSRTSFNGHGGVAARPTPNEVAAMHERHIVATQEQIRNQRVAREDKSQFASANHGGSPANLAAARAPERVPNNMNQRPSGNNPASRPGTNNNGQRNNTPVNAGTTRPNTPATMGQHTNMQTNARPNNQQANLPGGPGVNAPGTKGMAPNTQGTRGQKTNKNNKAPKQNNRQENKKQ
jgi:WXXGXW repeat (2 copies)